MSNWRPKTYILDNEIIGEKYLFFSVDAWFADTKLIAEMMLKKHKTTTLVPFSIFISVL